MMNVEINLNTEVRATLTPDGVYQMMKHFTDLGLSFEHAHSCCHYNAETHTVQIPLWEVMNILGPRCVMGFSPVFEANRITFDIPE